MQHREQPRRLDPLIWPPASPGPARPSVRRAFLTGFAFLGAAVGLIGALSVGYIAAATHEVSDEVSPARLTATVRRLATALPTLEGLEVDYYEGSGGCRGLSYRHGEYNNVPESFCAGMLTDSVPFDATAAQDLGQIDAAIAATGVDVYRVLGSSSARFYQFDTAAAGWCLSCPDLDFYFAPQSGPPVTSPAMPEDDPGDHYIAINADWYVAVQLHQGFLGSRFGPVAGAARSAESRSDAPDTTTIRSSVLWGIRSPDSGRSGAPDRRDITTNRETTRTRLGQVRFSGCSARQSAAQESSWYSAVLKAWHRPPSGRRSRRTGPEPTARFRARLRRRQAGRGSGPLRPRRGGRRSGSRRSARANRAPGARRSPRVHRAGRHPAALG